MKRMMCQLPSVIRTLSNVEKLEIVLRTALFDVLMCIVLISWKSLSQIENFKSFFGQS